MARTKKQRAHRSSSPARRRRDARRPDATGEARRQSALAQLGELALDTEASDPLFDAACALVQQALACDAAIVAERAADGLALHASAGLSPERRGAPLGPPGRTDHHLAALGFGAGTEVPFPGRLRPPLVLGAYRLAARPFGAESVHFLEGMARLLAAALMRQRAERELVERERLLRACYDARPDPELLVDDAGTVRDANATACRVLGRERRGLIGRAILGRGQGGPAPLGATALASLAAMSGAAGPEVSEGVALGVTGEALPLHAARVTTVAPGFALVKLDDQPVGVGPEVQRAGAPRPRARVLVVDDEPLVGTAVARTLGEEHEVSVVEGAVQALARIDAGERFDAILTDLLMPGMSGLDLYRALASRHPAQARRVAFLTGGSCDGEVHAFLEAQAIPWLEKPFELGALRRLIAERASR